MSLIDKLFKGKSHAEVIEDIVYNLRLLAEGEADTARLYELCAEVAESEKEFWKKMSDSEFRHAENIKKMIALIEKDPGDYKPGVSFNPASIRAFSLQVGGMLHDIKSGGVSAERRYLMADEIENSVIEMDYAGIVKTGNADFKKLVREIDDESREHRDSVKARIANREGR